MRTIYDDWRIRRAQMDGVELLPRCSDQARILDFLISRYADDPAAQAPARSQSSTVFFNTRAIAAGDRDATRVAADAHRRARTILTRMADLNLQADVGAPGRRAKVEPEAPQKPRVSKLRCWSKWSRECDQTDQFVAHCKAELARFQKLLEADWAVLKDVLDCALWGWPLKAQLSDILDVLVHCAEPDITRLLLNHWASGDYPAVQPQLETYLRTNDVGAEVLRGDLAKTCAFERTRAARLLGKLGSLQDIALLQDLLAQPNMQAFSLERSVYVSAIEELAGMTVRERMTG